MPIKTILASAYLVAVTFFVTPLSAGTAEDLAVVLAPVSKFCLIRNVPAISAGFLTAGAAEKIFDVLSCYPKDSAQSKAYTKLAKMLYSPEYGASMSSLREKNAGLVNYFAARLKSDERFFQEAKAFYEELKSIDEGFYFSQHPELISKISNLTQVAGAHEFSSVEPGWLWTLALKHARQNAESAIEIIGLCGHDDTHNESLTNGKGETFSCPTRGITLFYTAAGLGRGVDIDPRLKVEIAAVQAPTLGPSALPSKVYHLYGGALFACGMKAEGLSDNEITAAGSLVARLYRSVDMRNRVLSYAANAEEPRPNLERDLRDSCRKQSGRFVCPDFRSARGYDQDRENRFVAGKMTEFDSYALIERWKMIKKLPIVGLPLDLDLTISAAQLAAPPWDWTPERFEKAVQRLRTYAMDFRWSQAQHQIGARFAIEHCAPKN